MTQMIYECDSIGLSIYFLLPDSTLPNWKQITYQPLHRISLRENGPAMVAFQRRHPASARSAIPEGTNVCDRTANVGPMNSVDRALEADVDAGDGYKQSDRTSQMENG